MTFKCINTSIKERENMRGHNGLWYNSLDIPWKVWWSINKSDVDVIIKGYNLTQILLITNHIIVWCETFDVYSEIEL